MTTTERRCIDRAGFCTWSCPDGQCLTASRLPGHIRRQVDVSIGGQHVATLDVEAGSVASFTDRTDATDAEFEARLKRLDRLEVADESAVDRIARAIHADDYCGCGEWPCADGWNFTRHAHAAIAALKPPPPDGGDVR